MEYKGGLARHVSPFSRGRRSRPSAQPKTEKERKGANIFKGGLGVQFFAPVIHLVWVRPNSQATWGYEKTQTMFLLRNWKKRKPEHELKEKGRLKAVEVKELN